jgi:hypothetical protein
VVTAGRQKTRTGRALNYHAPDAVSGEYRGKFSRRKTIFLPTNHANQSELGESDHPRHMSWRPAGRGFDSCVDKIRELRPAVVPF